MITLWYPGFVDNSSDINLAPIAGEWENSDTLLTEERYRLKIRNPEFYDTMSTAEEVQTRRTMRGGFRSTLKRVRALSYPLDVTFNFKALRSQTRIYLEHFLLCADGKYVGYKDPDGYYWVAFFPSQEVQFISVRNIGVPGIAEEMFEVSVQVKLIRRY